MGKSLCPFCNSEDTLNIAYGYIGYKKDKKNYIDQEIIGEKINFRKGYEKIDFDGERLISRNPNRYCNKCKRSFHSRKILYTVDIKNIDLILCTNESYYRYSIEILDNSCKCIKRINRMTKIEKILSTEEKNQILSSIKKYKPNLWHGHYGLPYNHEKYYWILKCTYYNGVDFCKSGNDMFPENWEYFIKSFREIFKDEILYV